MKNWTELLEQYITGTLPPAELEAFLLQADQHPEELQAALLALLQTQESLNLGTEEQRKRTLYQVLNREAVPEIQKQRKLPILRWMSAAAACIAITVTGWLLLNKKEDKAPTINPVVAAIHPGTNIATLTLADGTIISLDSAGNTHIADQQGVQINNAGGALSYQNPTSDISKSANLFNLLSTPRGGQYQVVLPDGTRVYLNADSKLRYPTRFTGNNRTVSLSGEAYFEVAPDMKKPFLVHVANKSWVEVLGTSFNINAYMDESVMQTTLVTGRIKVKGAGSKDSVILKPGQQAVEAQRLSVRTADVEKVLAWKNGMFNFEGLDFKTGMRQLARWYNVDLVFETNREYPALSGEMDRGLTMAEVLKILAELNIHCRLEDRQLIIQ